MPLTQMPRVPLCSREGASGGQPFRWAVLYNPLANGQGDFFVQGVLLGYQGWAIDATWSPFWRYWTGDIAGRRIWVQQLEFYDLTYRWHVGWFEPGEEEASLLLQAQFPTHNRQPWDDVPFNSPWLAVPPFSDPSWIPGDTWCVWFKTPWDAIAAFPYCLRQDDYLDTFGVYLYTP